MKKKTKIPKTFIGFLIASFFIWLLITFSREYTTVISFPVSYKNIPQNKLLQETPLKQIDIKLKASGFKIIASNIFNKNINIEASSLKKNRKSNYFIVTKSQLTDIQKQMLSGVDLLEIVQDTVYLNLGTLTSKKVALKPNLNIQYHVGYDLLGKVTIKPDSIIVAGPENQIKNLEYLPLEKLELNNTKSNFEKKVSILIPKKHKNLKLNVSEAMISGNVEKFTEGVLEIPFTIKNLPENVNLSTLTEKVEVKFVVSLSNFAKVTEASLIVECDFEIAKKNNLSYLIPKLISKPDFIKSYKIVPNKIDFLIQK